MNNGATQDFLNWIHGVHMARAKTARADTDPRRVQLLKIIEEQGAVTQGQLARLTGFSWGQLQWHLYVLERDGKVRRVSKNGVVYYVPARLTPSLLDLEEVG